MNAQMQSDTRPVLWDRVKQHIESKRRPIQDEIRRYPPPIPACDAHFNHLLDQRAMLSRELQRLEAARQESGTDAAVERFIRSSPCVDGDAVREFLPESERSR
jgi:hypothetical protein